MYPLGRRPGEGFRLVRRGLALAILAWASSSAAAQVQAAGTAADPSVRIDDFVRAEMARQGIPGVAVGIVNKGRVTTRGYGLANVELNVPASDSTVFQSGSLGKMFTAT